MDAASHTGVDNIRELIDGVSYKPVETKYRIYIIDEVHMLSKGAFNALLKTLEEPPEHTKFIFATTEIKKVPVTVLSRCQRFDLKRVSIPNLVSHLEKICLKEKISFDNESLGLIALSSEGSVRDSMSILDQAAAMMNDKINSNELKTMLALPNRLLSITIVENTLNGEIKKSLELYDNYISSGGNGESILNDCLEVIHLITRYAVVGENSINLTLQSITNEEHDKFIKLSKIQMPDLIRAWQIVLKGLEEIKFSPDFDKSAAMILIRLAYASSLPEPGEILKKLEDKFAAKIEELRVLVTRQEQFERDQYRLQEIQGKVRKVIGKSQEIRESWKEEKSSLQIQIQGMMNAFQNQLLHTKDFVQAEISLKHHTDSKIIKQLDNGL